MELIVKIKHPEGEALTMEVDSSDTVRDIKHMIKNHNGLPADWLSLVLEGGRVLADDDGTAAEYGIEEGSVIRVFHRRPDGGTTLRLSVVARPVGGERAAAAAALQVAVNEGSSVGSLRWRLEEARQTAGFPLPRGGEYCLRHRGVEMEEDKSFDWHGVVTGDEIEVYAGGSSSSSSHSPSPSP